ncbi:UMP-CMP kinase 2, mitochondrial-like [Macrosteles quadrilineatus]|uniref:UMP-CMP kinase 2, mitochondrial-like n=1 Tax=Macrosteles quadrilineatus TaxID=74068 RepID=UPI0023E1C67D|nr:UMP-CMP kinase 2, mitochondrial-like [Macrosteles quadrilineatus]
MRQNQIVQLPRGPRKPFIVIEGVKGSGKSSLALKFAQSFNGTYLRAPPEYFAPFKGWVQTRNKLERNAFHALSNYLMAEEAKRLMQTRMVVMDLYWHGLVAYELSRLSGATGILPVTSSPVYKFPEDLLVPDISFYLLVLEDKRYYREKETGKPAVSKKIREIMFRAYSKFFKPRMVPIFADREQEEVGDEMKNMTCRILQVMTLLGLVRFACLLVLVASQDLDDGSTNETFQSQPEPSYDQAHYSEGPGGYSPPEGQKGVGKVINQVL